LLLGAGLVAALVAAAQAIRRRSGLGAGVAAGGVMAFAYWFVHGSVDWFWEFPALGGLAFALLGLAAGLAPRAARLRPGPARPVLGGRAPVAAAAVGAVLVALALAGPWLSERYVSQAAGTWRQHPSRAFDNLDAAAALDP